MYVFNDFIKALQLFVCSVAGQDIDVKLPTSKQRISGHIRFYLTKNCPNLPEKIMENIIIIERCLYSSHYVSVWLKQESWTSSVFKEILTSGCRYGCNEELKGTVISVDIDEYNDSVTYLRIELLKNAVLSVAEINGCTIGSNGLNLFISKKNNPKNSNLILCGSVVCNTTVEKYKQQKQDNITKMSASRIESEEYPISIISKLCHISIIYELLSVRHNKDVNTECDTSNKDNGIFIMYNYSRLYQIWVAYEKGVIENNYKPLPDIDAINFRLLTSEEEWLLIFNYLSTYPSIIQESVKYIFSGNVDVHRLCKFLMEVSSAVSLFYHRHHILSDPISSLLPLMYARLYLVKNLLQLYENVFQLLGIEAVYEM